MSVDGFWNIGLTVWSAESLLYLASFSGFYSNLNFFVVWLDLVNFVGTFYTNLFSYQTTSKVLPPPSV